jgi:endonuclease YncB( thermonuclease family)
MAESTTVSATCWLVAHALAGGLALGSVLAAPLSAAAATLISGRAAAIDGDTIDIDGKHIRLEGIDAPEAGQTCKRQWLGSWNCGAVATRELDRKLAGRRVECESRGQDRYGRVLGVCFVDGRDINAEMVRSGLAWAFVKYSHTYVEDEAAARAAKLGIWQGEAEPAWVYREKRWTVAEEAAPKGCAIKGNVTEHGHIYHMPWSPWYDKVRIEAAKGERWFCSEAEAQEAGWRPAATH